MNKTISLLLFGIIFSACNQNDSYENANAPRAKESAFKKTTEATENKAPRKDYVTNADVAFTSQNGSVGVGNIAPEQELLVDRKIIWDAHLEFRAKDVEKSGEAIRKLCSAHDGYLSDMERHGSSYETSVTMNIRVASDRFHELVAAIKGESEHLDLARISSDDVTEEYVDIENRLETKRKARERYIQILRSKTGTIEEVIQAEDAIRRITEEIEAKEGRLRYLSNQVEFSTIQIRMYTPIDAGKAPVAQEETYGDEAKTSFSAGWNFIKRLGLALISIWPLLLVLGGVVYWKRRWFSRFFASTK